MSFGPEYFPNGAEAKFVVITGTHGSGKSTVWGSIAESLEVLQEAPVVPTEPWPTYGILDGSTIVACIPEAATAYMAKTGRTTAATTGYTREDQVAIENYAMSLEMTARCDLGEIFTKRPELKRAILFADRSALDGPEYRRNRIEDDSDWVSNYDTELALYGTTFNTVHSVLLNHRQLFRDYLQRYCDRVLIADATEIIPELSATRIDDLVFRDQIHHDLIRAYTDAVGPERIVHLRGTKPERLAAALQLLRTL